MTSRAFVAGKFRWLDRVTRDRAVLAMDVRVAAALLRYFTERDQGGRAYPGYRKLATDIGVDETTVLRAVRRLHQRGHLIIVWGKPGRGSSNSYWMRGGEKLAQPQVFDPPKKPAQRQVSKAGKPASQSNKTCLGATEPLREPIKEGDVTHPPSLNGRDPHLEVQARLEAVGGALDAPPPAGALDGEIVHEGEIIPPSSPDPPHDQENTLAALQAIWQRGHLSDDEPTARAREAKAWERACRVGDPAAILAAAKVWIAAYDAPRYLPKLSNWLDREGFKKSPPKKKNSNAQRGGRHHGQRHQRARKGDVSAAIARRARGG